MLATFRFSALGAALLFVAPALANQPDSATKGPSWISKSEEAWERARSAGQLVLIDFYADWCSWCKVMEQESFSRADFAELARSLVLLRVDVEDRGEGSRLADRYDASNLPLLLLADGTGREIARIQGYFPPQRLLARLQSELRRYQHGTERLNRALASDQPSDWEQGLQIALDRGDGTKALQLVERLRKREAATADPLRAGWFDLLAADALRLLGRHGEARVQLQAALSRPELAQHPQLSEQASWLDFAIARDQGDCAAVRAALDRWSSARPASARLYEARKEIEKGSKGTLRCG